MNTRLPACPGLHETARWVTTLLMVFAMFAAALPAQAQSSAEPGQTSAPSAAFRIGPGDVLSVQVWKQPSLSLQLPVLPDGSLRYPLAGELQVQGRTLAEVEKMLTDRIGESLREAVVSVTVSQVNSHRIYILGEVLRPGEYPLRGPVSLVQSLAMASGLTPFARRDAIMILRNQGGTQTRTSFDLDAYLRDPTAVDPLLMPGDTVVVR